MDFIVCNQERALPAPLRKVSARDRRLRQRIGAALRKARTEAELSLSDVADTVGVSPSTVLRIEKGLTGMTVDMCARMARAVSVSMADVWPVDAERV